VQVRLADVRVARLFEELHGWRRLVGHVVDEEARAVRRGKPGRVEEVLDRQRTTRCGPLRPREEDAVEVARARDSTW
jgi:hypothetical protein